MSIKEITVLSGKGGTGKTSVTAALAAIAHQTVFCDNDVDAADLHLILNPEIKETNTFISGWKAKIDQNTCSNCGICLAHCRFSAIETQKNGTLNINSLKCEGCRLCERVCPTNAISSEQSDNNFWYVSDTRFGKLIHAVMEPGEENSGKLVTQVRKTAKEIAQKTNASFIINDGPPGIGCAAISSLTGANMVLLVIEPSKSGLHDIKRLIQLVQSFNIETYAVINKYDINPKICGDIETFLASQSIQIIAKIPFDKQMVEALIENKTIIEYNTDSIISKEIINIWHKISN